MTITMRHIGRDDAVEVDETDSLAIGRYLIQGYRRAPARPAPPAQPNEPSIPPPSAAREDDE